MRPSNLPPLGIPRVKRPRSWRVSKKRKTIPVFSGALARSPTPKITWKQGITRNSEHPAPSGTSRPGFRLQLAGGRALPREAAHGARAQRGPERSFRGGLEGRLRGVAQGGRAPHHRRESFRIRRESPTGQDLGEALYGHH